MTLHELLIPNWTWLLSLPFLVAIYINPAFRLTAERFYLWTVRTLRRVGFR